MHLLASPFTTAREAGSLGLAAARGARALRAQQEARLRRMVGHARQRSPLFRELYRGLPEAWTLADLPVTRKPDLMARFDDWVTDPEVTLALVEKHLADPSALGQRLLGRYVVVTTSGVTGRRGIFLHDARAVAAYTALVLARCIPSWSAAEGGAVRRRGLRVAAIVATGGHFAAAAMGEMVRERIPGGEARMRVLSVMTGLEGLRAGLEAFDPTILFGYPSALALLAAEHDAGRLRLAPRLVLSGGESLTPGDRARIVGSFGCTVRDVYAASEFPLLASECREGRMHWNADRVILEAVDAEGQPVPAGEPGATTLITNLVDHVQPILRYDLGDSTTLLEGACPCGSHLPTMRVEGRKDDTLRFPGVTRAEVPILPLALGTVIEETPGVARFQAYQARDGSLHVRLETTGDAGAVWARVADELRRYLAAQGAAEIRIERDPAPPERDARSGKYRQVWRAG